MLNINIYHLVHTVNQCKVTVHQPTHKIRGRKFMRSYIIMCSFVDLSQKFGCFYVLILAIPIVCTQIAQFKYHNHLIAGLKSISNTVHVFTRYLPTTVLLTVQLNLSVTNWSYLIHCQKGNKAQRGFRDILYCTDWFVMLHELVQAFPIFLKYH